MAGPKKAVAPAVARPPQGPQAKALYAYTVNAPDELGFDEGEIMAIQQKDPSGWWECRRADGSVGWVRNRGVVAFAVVCLTNYFVFFAAMQAPATYLQEL